MEELNLVKLNNKLLQQTEQIVTRGVILSKESVINDVAVVGIGIKSYLRKEFLQLTDVFRYNRDRLKELEDRSVLKEIKEVVKLEPAVKRIVTNVSYDKVAKIQLPVPVGMTTDMVTALTLLDKSTELINTNLIKTIDEIDTLVSKVIADPQFRISNRPIIKNSKTKEHNEFLQDVLGKIINPANYEDRKAYEDLYPNVASLKTVYEMLLETNKINNSKTLTKIDKITKSTAEKVKTLYDLSENIKTFKISKNVLDALTNELQSAGNFVTNSVSIIHLNNQLAGTYKNTIKLLDQYS